MNSKQFVHSCFLLVVLALVAKDTLADHEPGHAPVGPSGSSGGGPIWALMDSDSPPKPVGIVDHAEDGIVFIQLTLFNEDVLLEVRTVEIIENNAVYFTTSDCTGQAYMFDDLSSVFARPVVIAMDEGDPSVRRAYERVGSFGSVSVNSFLFLATCSPFSFTDSFAPVVPGSDLHVLYPPPYTLVGQ